MEHWVVQYFKLAYKHHDERQSPGRKYIQFWLCLLDRKESQPDDKIEETAGLDLELRAESYRCIGKTETASRIQNDSVFKDPFKDL